MLNQVINNFFLAHSAQIFDIDEKTNLLQTRNDLLDSEKKLSNLLEEIDKSEMAEAQAEQVIFFLFFWFEMLLLN